MNVKTIIQLIIFLIIIIFLYVFIKNTFLTDKKDIINLDTNIEKDIKIKKNLTKSDASNLIEKLNYK